MIANIWILLFVLHFGFASGNNSVLGSKKLAQTASQTCGLQEAEEACPKTSCRIYYPATATVCRATATFNIDRPTTLIGDGEGSAIQWAAGVPGIECLNQAGMATTIQGMHFESLSNSRLPFQTGLDDGIWNQCNYMKILDNIIQGFGRYGINTDTTTPHANANGSLYEGNLIVATGSDCMYFAGPNSKAITTINNILTNCGGFGIRQVGGADHNVSINDEVASSGYNPHTNSQVCSSGPTDFVHGSYYDSGYTNFYFNPYNEGGCNSVLILAGFDTLWIEGGYGAVQHVYGPHSTIPSGYMNSVWNLGGNFASSQPSVSPTQASHTLTLTPRTFAFLPACSAALAGETAEITDSKTNTWGEVIAGGGKYTVSAHCNGSSWTVMGD